MILALEIFGYPMPNPLYALVIVAFIVAFFFINRSSPETADTAGQGPMWQCKRCGFEFQPQQVELMSNGDVRRSFDEGCPKCTSGDTGPK